MNASAGALREHLSAEHKMRIMWDGRSGYDSMAELCRKEGITQGLYCMWSKEFKEAGRR